MKKFIFIFCFILILFSCKGTGYKNPHEKRNLTIRNNTANNIDIIVKARYNSVEYFNDTLTGGNAVTLTGVPLCTMIPEQSYEWRVSKTDENGDNPVWFIRNVTDDEKIKVTVYNNLAPKKPKLICKIKDTGDKYKTEADFTTVSSPCILYLYDAEYDFSLKDAKLYYKKKADGNYDKSKTYFGLGTDAGPEWTTEPVFFTIVYDTAAKTISIIPN